VGAVTMPCGPDTIQALRAKKALEHFE